jgi:hypothetical protein
MTPAWRCCGTVRLRVEDSIMVRWQRGGDEVTAPRGGDRGVLDNALGENVVGGRALRCWLDEDGVWQLGEAFWVQHSEEERPLALGRPCSEAWTLGWWCLTVGAA